MWIDLDRQPHGSAMQASLLERHKYSSFNLFTTAAAEICKVVSLFAEDFLTSTSAHRVDGKKILSSSPESGSMSILIFLLESFSGKTVMIILAPEMVR